MKIRLNGTALGFAALSVYATLHGLVPYGGALFILSALALWSD
jgi:hypothetical protein